MSNNNSTELIAWAREVCALHTELARPLEWVSDPRLRALQEALPTMTDYSTWEPAALGEWYFTKVGVNQMPACPLPAPEWGIAREVRCGEWPDVAIVDSGAVAVSGASSAYVEREATILVDVLPAGWNDGPDGEALSDEPDPRLPGDVHERTFINVKSATSEGSTFYLTVEGAEELECVLGDVLAGLRVSS